MMSRTKRKQIADETLEILERGWYDNASGSRVKIEEDLRLAIDASELRRPDDLKRLTREPVERNHDTTITVMNETTLVAAKRLAADVDDGAVFVLNFASAKNPGGGFLGGSQAQEESIARSSALYPTLSKHRDYYDINRACGSALYTDHMIYSPNVPVFRNDAGDLLNSHYLLSIMTAPAVNAGDLRKKHPHRVGDIEETMRRRIEFVLAVAAARGHTHLVLGAWGCGVFRNDPNLIASLFAEQLLDGGTYAAAFNKIVFAVLDRRDMGIIRPFERVLQESEATL